MALLPPMPRHCRKLVRPNTQPQISPPSGPSATAATASGMTFSVIASGPMFR